MPDYAFPLKIIIKEGIALEPLEFHPSISEFRLLSGLARFCHKVHFSKDAIEKSIDLEPLELHSQMSEFRLLQPDLASPSRTA